jgi:hypothetical protein
MTRRTRRRLFVIGGSALLGGTVPVWMPALFSSFPAFKVERVEVSGTVYVTPDQVVRLAGVSPDASVWDDPAEWEARVAAHPMIIEARVRRNGMHGVEIRVVEERPVALMATPTLVAVNAKGRILPLNPWETSVDLPIVRGEAEVHADVVVSQPHRDLAELLGRLGGYDAAFVEQISEIWRTEQGALEILMLPTAHAGRIVLSAANPVQGLRRVELALNEAGDRRVELADARFQDRVVLRFQEGA